MSKKLWYHVILQAIKDLTSYTHRQSAEEFFASNNESLSSICFLCGIDSQNVVNLYNSRKLHKWSNLIKKGNPYD